MNIKIIYCFTLTFVALSSPMALTKNQDELNNNAHPKRKTRSAGCGSFITNYQTFHSNVTFQSYFPSPGKSCPESCSKNTNPDPDKASVSKSFILDFDFGNYALDLYLLIDGTGSFTEDRAILAGIAPDLFQEIRKLSTNSFIGFGYFGDKSGKFGPENIGIVHKLALTNDIAKFARALQEKEETDGGDGPEDALTALSEIVTCKDQVGWRNSSLRLLFLATDASYHIAGEGTGAKYDVKCHLDSSGRFVGTPYSALDYPTEEQTKFLLKSNAVKPIFGIQGKSTVDYYKVVTKALSPNPVVVELSSNSEDIIAVIEKAYKEYRKNIMIETTLKGMEENYRKVSFVTKCIDVKGFPLEGVQNAACSIPDNGKIRFQINVTLPCPWEHDDVELIANPIGVSDWRPINLASVCD